MKKLLTILIVLNIGIWSFIVGQKSTKVRSSVFNFRIYSEIAGKVYSEYTECNHKGWPFIASYEYYKGDEVYAYNFGCENPSKIKNESQWLSITDYLR